MANYRSLKIADSIKTQISIMMCGELADPRFDFVTILHVDLAKDLSHAKVSFTTSEKEPKSIEAALNNAAGFIRTQLAQALNLRYTPTLRFVFDADYAQSEKVEMILEKLRQERALNDDNQPTE
jgi:ribosome-binding factor A